MTAVPERVGSRTHKEIMAPFRKAFPWAPASYAEFVATKGYDYMTPEQQEMSKARTYDLWLAAEGAK